MTDHFEGIDKLVKEAPHTEGAPNFRRVSHNSKLEPYEFHSRGQMQKSVIYYVMYLMILDINEKKKITTQRLYNEVVKS